LYVSRETHKQTDRRLRRVAAATDIQVLDGEWWFEEFPRDRIALTREVTQTGQPPNVRAALAFSDTKLKELLKI
jgi:hypothetical protein